MKKIIFLVSLCLASNNALAICSDYTSLTDCNNDSSCYWKQGFGQQIGGGSSGTCNECTNTRKSYSGVLSSLYGVITSSSNIVQQSYTYCQTIYSCASDSASIKVVLDAKYNPISNSKLTESLDLTCELCSSGMYKNNTGVVFLDYNELGAVDSEGNVTSLPLSAGDIFQGCGTCGANADVNSEQTNCNCKSHYAVYNTSGSIYGTTNIAGRDCSPIIYTVYLNSTDTASTDSPSVKYKYGIGYELDGDNDFNDGTPVGSLSYEERTKQTMNGWYLSPTSSTQIFRAGALYDTTNVVTKCEQVLGCSTDGYVIHLYAKYSWNTYMLEYDADGDGVADKTVKTCTYNSDCTTPESPDASYYPAGKAFARWKLNGQSVAGGASIKSIETAMTSEFTDGVALLTAEFTTCPAGYYCPVGNTSKQPCPVGTTSDAGADDKTDCYVSEDTIFKDNNGEYQIPSGKVKVK